MPAEDPAELVSKAAALLATELGRPVSLSAPRALSDQHPVLRCRVEGADALRSLIVKRVTRTDFNAPGSAPGISQRFRNEWACLDFLRTLELAEPVGPRLLAASREESLLVIEDLGAGETLLDRLRGTDGDAARAGLVGLGTALGRMQAAAAARERDFRAIQAALDTASPLSDSTIDQRDRRERFHDVFDTLGLAPATGFWRELEAVETAVHEDSTFRSFLHADAGPHNVLCPDPASGRVRLLDFEFGDYRHGLLDVVSARLGFPHTGQVWSVPAADADALEAAYRAEVADALPAAQDDAAFEAALVDACAHWSLGRWSGYWTGYFKERMDPQARTEGDGSADEPAAAARRARQRARILTQHEGFLALADRTGRRPAITASLRGFLERLRERWPELEVMPVYAALDEGS